MENSSFNYKYSVPTEKERREIESIRRQYIFDEGGEVNLFVRLKKLHKGIKKAATVPSVIIGTFGTLVFGGGMTLVLEFDVILWGIIVSAVGIIPMVLAYPIYKLILKSKKRKYSEEIIRISNELLG